MYDIIDTVTTINGKTGAISAADLNAILTAAGYKLTDENTVTSINGKTGAIAASDIALVLTSAGYKLTDTTYSDATTSTAGLMTAADKTKLNGITAGAQPHIAPTTAEVKSALGTGEGTTKYLREDGTWQPIDGEYQDLTAGNVVGTFSDESEVSFRPTAGAVDVNSGKAGKGAKLMAVKGNTVKWNQLIENGNFSDGYNIFNIIGYTTSIDSDSSVKLFAADSSIGYYQFYRSLPIISSHKYITYYCLKTDTSNKLYVKNANDQYAEINTTTSYQYYRFITSGNSSGTHAEVNIVASSNISTTFPITINVKYIMRIDLTLIYGEGNEPTTPEQFEADYQRWFGKPLTYEDYDEGSLRPVKMAGIKTVGFNQWDEEWEVGLLTGNGGIVTGDRIVSSNMIPVISGKTYHFRIGANDNFAGRCEMYDSNGMVVAFTQSSYGELTIPQGVSFIRFCTNITYGTTYNHDICINISHSGARDGEYEPYWTSMLNVPVTTLKGKLNGEGSSVVVFPDGLKKAGNVYDEIVRRGDKTYAIKRIGAVDLGSLDWTQHGNAENHKSTLINGTPDTEKPICSRYDFVSFNNRAFVNGKCWVRGSEDYVIINDENYQDQATFKAAMNGVMLYYELETPEEYLLDDFELPQEYDVDDYGTEEVQLGTNGCAPVLDIKYGINAGDTIKNLPHNYVSAVGEQSFTETQKARARKNIGINNIDDVPT